MRPLFCLLAALAAAPAAHAQDSFVREADFLTGRPLLSVLGSGLGQQPAALTLEFSCPGTGVWSLDLHGADFPVGAPITFDLGDAERGWQEVRLLAVQRPDADRLRIVVDEASFRAALAGVAGVPETATTAAVLQVGSEFGVAVGLEALAREIGHLAQDCQAPRAARVRDAAPLARYAR
ncbi:hypothetical protein [Roseomonas fluvialis]|uniref:Uncharacterized protein n=1 Tax=Roseomonas fluvialis TaxID=1750527 RepID=A0ABN6P2Y5_9PROT|nr:hypothetical protein [Roseomonas fluvialis]BDG72806.1 hypothetical protein Rmf_27350 [Roseomonas fluvialis]